MVVNTGDVVVYDDRNQRVGQTLSGPALSDAVPVVVDNQTVGYVVPAIGRDAPPAAGEAKPAENGFLSALNKEQRDAALAA